MGDPKALIGLIALGLLCGCALTARGPGERLEDFPEKVWKQKKCDKQELPYFEIEKLELWPRRLEPGQQFRQRLIYTLCPTRPTGVVTGALETKIFHRGKAIVQQHVSEYDLKPGRWVVDALVQLPEDAKQGVYALELRFESSDVEFERLIQFVVDAARD